MSDVHMIFDLLIIYIILKLILIIEFFDDTIIFCKFEF